MAPAPAKLSDLFATPLIQHRANLGRLPLETPASEGFQVPSRETRCSQAVFLERATRFELATLTLAGAALIDFADPDHSRDLAERAPLASSATGMPHLSDCSGQAPKRTSTPQMTMTTPPMVEMASPRFATFSASTNTARKPTQTRFITPSTNSRIIKAQQQRRHKAP